VRIGIVSDIHGNAAGLECALDRMGDVDELICLGDVVEEYRFVNEAVALLRQRDARCVLGNHDVGLLSAPGARARTAGHVDRSLVDWLESQPLRIETTIRGARVLITHASPCAPHTQYVLPHSPELKRIGEVDADVVLIGHTHKQMVAHAGSVLVVNPGSAGQARDHSNGKRLPYAVLDLDGGDVRAEQVTVDDYTIADDRTQQLHRAERAASCSAGGRASR
jgi:putative phosphoesterase